MTRHLKAIETCLPGCYGCSKCTGDPADWVTQTKVTICPKTLALLGALMRSYEAHPVILSDGYGPFVEYVTNGYGQHGVLVIWESDEDEGSDLWWFADENEDELIPNIGSLLDFSLRVNERSEVSSHETQHQDADAVQ